MTKRQNKCVSIDKKENYKKTKEYDFVQASNSETLKKMKTGLELELFQTLKEEQTNTVEPTEDNYIFKEWNR